VIGNIEAERIWNEIVLARLSNVPAGETEKPGNIQDETVDVLKEI
jgi:hypothetical protein